MKKYKFRGKILEEYPRNIKILNYALALNGSKDRYEEI